jgi:guanylate kinase
MRPHEVPVLLSRLEERGTDTAEQMTNKLARAAEDMEYCKAQQPLGTFDLIVVNAAVEVALGEIKEAAVRW